MTEPPGVIPKKDYFRVKNDWWDALTSYRVPGEQMQVLMHIIRQTYGWRVKEKEISIMEFVQATDIKAPNVYRAIKSLAEKRLIIVIKNDNRKWSTYRFNKYYKQWKPLSKKIMAKSIIKKDNETLSKKIIPVIKKDNAHPIKEITVKEQLNNTSAKNGFGAFWESYPIKKGKKKAHEKWEILRKKKQLPPIDDIIAAINNQTIERNIKKGDNQFVAEWKYPATWLNQQCWTDECDLETEREKWINQVL